MGQVKGLISAFNANVDAVIKINGKLAGVALSIIVDYDGFSNVHTYKEITENYTFNSHTDDGDVLYGIDVFMTSCLYTCKNNVLASFVGVWTTGMAVLQTWLGISGLCYDRLHGDGFNGKKYGKCYVLKHISSYKLLLNIENSTIRAAEIVDDLLAKDGSKTKIKRKIQINKLIHDVADSIYDSINKRIELKINTADEVFKVRGNFSDLYSAVLNLLINAKEAIKDKGKIEISTYITEYKDTE